MDLMLHGLFGRSSLSQTTACSKDSKNKKNQTHSHNSFTPTCICKLIKAMKGCGIMLLNNRRGYCGCSCYCDMLFLTVFVMFIFPHPLLPWAHSHFYFFSLALFSPFSPSPLPFLFLLSQLEVLHYRLSISSKHHGSPAHSSYQALHAYQVLPSFHFVSF